MAHSILTIGRDVSLSSKLELALCQAGFNVTSMPDYTHKRYSNKMGLSLTW